MRRSDLDPRNYDFRSQSMPLLDTFQGYRSDAPEPLGLPSTLESSLVSPAHDLPFSANLSVPEEPLRRAYHEPPEVDQYYAVPGVSLYSPYEPAIPRLGAEPPMQPAPFLSRADDEVPEQLAYEDSVAAGLMIQMALISRSAAHTDDADNLLVPAKLAELGRSVGGLESLL